MRHLLDYFSLNQGWGAEQERSGSELDFQNGEERERSEFKI